MEYEKSFWNERYARDITSGDGSYGQMLQRKLNWLKGLDITTISEIGCGDFNFGKNLLLEYPNAKYYGTDISDFIIEKNRTLYPYAEFGEDIRPGDLLLCVDVLFHIIDPQEATAMLSELKNTWTKYLAITAYEYDQQMEHHIRIRKFDPAYFGKPIMREILEEDGNLYFYLFKRD